MSGEGTHDMDATGIPALTLEQYDAQVAVCTGLFLDKMHDYGTAWRILRPSSLTDQIFIKAQRIRTCLLYTSPSPRDLSTSRMPSSA